MKYFNLFVCLFDPRLGLDPKLLAKILNMSSGRCWSSEVYNPVPGVMEGVPSANNYQGGFGSLLMVKVWSPRARSCETENYETLKQNHTLVLFFFVVVHKKVK